jgi:hypothetical protein
MAPENDGLADPVEANPDVAVGTPNPGKEGAPVVPATGEQQAALSGEQGEALTADPATAEAVEKEPQLDLTVDRPCNNPAGRYVGLNAVQRGKLGVEVGGTVELFEEGVSIGVFTVGKGASELAKMPERFSANVVMPGKMVTVKKAIDRAESVMSLPITHGIENVPQGLDEVEAGKYAERTQRRIGIITERFKDAETGVFMTVPTAVLNQITGGVARVAAIAEGMVKVGGREVKIIMVPAGTDIGLTTKAAKLLGFPQGLKELRFRVSSGVLVVD